MSLADVDTQRVGRDRSFANCLEGELLEALRVWPSQPFV
jgi:hypothetical protein